MLNRKISVTSGGKRKEVPIREAMILRLAETALKGDQKAIAFFMNLEERLKRESSALEDGENAASDLADAAVIASFLARHKSDPEKGA